MYLGVRVIIFRRRTGVNDCLPFLICRSFPASLFYRFVLKFPSPEGVISLNKKQKQVKDGSKKDGL